MIAISGERDKAGHRGVGVYSEQPTDVSLGEGLLIGGLLLKDSMPGGWDKSGPYCSVAQVVPHESFRCFDKEEAARDHFQQGGTVLYSVGSDAAG